MIRGTTSIVAGLIWRNRRSIASRLLYVAVVASAFCGCDNSESAQPPRALPCESPICNTHCDPLRGCVECLFDADCGDGRRCDDRACRDVVPCTSEEECEAPQPICDQNARECIACRVDSDCAGTARCVASKCEAYQACESDTECGDGRSCVERRCATPCDRTSDCPDVYHCSSGACVLDVCEAGRTSCDADGDGVRTCVASGEREEVRSCAARESCAPSSARCERWQCEPGSRSCDAGARHVEVCSADGFSVVESVDCAESGRACVEGACVERACEPDSVSCRDGVLYRCASSGSEEELVERCAADAVCDEQSGACLPLACVPGSAVCEGSVLTICDEAGTGYVRERDCADTDEGCANRGACHARVCLQPFVCNEGVSYACEADGTELVLRETCSLNDDPPRSCNVETGKCEPTACTPEQPVCAGNLATVCREDGSGPREDGVDCSATGLACWEGDCLPVACRTPFSCEGAELYRCEQNGTARVLVDDCSPALCDAVAGACRPEICEASQATCDGNVATTCNDRGTGYVGARLDCGATDEVCIAGACRPRDCEPDAVFCREGDVRVCDDRGASSQLEDDCAAFEHCVAGETTCAYDACAGGAPVCDGNVATTCLADGSGPALGGTDCATRGQTCRLGACVATACTPNERFCSGGNVRLCNSSGTASAPFDTCDASQFCNDALIAHCADDVCDATGAACNGEQIAICNADGSGFVASGADCAATGLVCTLDAECAAVAQDTLGTNALSESVTGGFVRLTVVDVQKTRRLTGVEALLQVAPGTPLDWVVYQRVGVSDAFERVLIAPQAAVGPGAARFQSSGPITTVLGAGGRYAIGVQVNGAHTVFSGGPALPRYASLGRVVGQFDVSTNASTPPAELQISSLSTLPNAVRLSTAAVPQ